jgi:hypothetical protein
MHIFKPPFKKKFHQILIPILLKFKNLVFEVVMNDEDAI